MIGQDTGLELLVPIALTELMKNPFAEGDFYPGDLLKSILKSDKDYWRTHPQEKERVMKIFLRASNEIETIEITEEIKKDLFQAFDEFCQL